MSRKRELTWQLGSDGRSGRWRKRYKGRSYYFPGGRGKTDRDAYDAAKDEWGKLKAQLRSAEPKRHQLEYEHEIAKWTQVLSWSREHEDDAMAEVASRTIDRLRRDLTAVTPRPLPAGHTFDAYFKPEVRYPLYAAAVIELGNRMGRVTKPTLISRTTAAMELFSNAKDSILLPQATERRIVPSAGTETVEDSLLIEKRIWEDRLNVMQRVAPQKDRTISMQIEMFLKVKEHEAGASKISTSRLYALRLHLTGFADWIGGDKSVDKIAGQDLVNYRMHLLQQVADEKLARTTASDRMTSIKSFVRWLWQTEAISELPRVLHPKTKMLEIGKGAKPILTFTESEIATLLTKASDRSKLYMLLALNCGMTQKDISDLREGEVDWKSGYIVRKRSKTRSYANVPCVSYKLWPETLELLLAHRDKSGSGRVLLNIRGEPLLTERLDSDGKYWKMDNVRNAYDRVRRKTKLNKPFKSLKKTSASLLRNNERFGSVVSVFLGHAPRDISDRHYAAVPQQLLENALSWLHGHLNQNGCFAYHR